MRFNIVLHTSQSSNCYLFTFVPFLPSGFYSGRRKIAGLPYRINQEFAKYEELLLI